MEGWERLRPLGSSRSHALSLSRSHALFITLHAPRSTLHAFGLLALAVLLAAGCTRPLAQLLAPDPPRPPRVSVYRSAALPGTGRLRLLVLPFRHPDPAASRSVTDAFLLELEKAQLFEVMSPYGPAAGALEQMTLWQDDALDVRALTALRRQLRVDALALGHVLDYRPFDPQALALRVQVVSTRTGAVLGGVEGCFDAREAGVQAALQRFHERQLQIPGRRGDWRLLLYSPRSYAQFVTHHLIAALETSSLRAVSAQAAATPRL